MAIQEFIGKITEIKDFSQGVRFFKISLDKEIEFKAGQFMTVIFEDEGKKYVRPYSISSNPSTKNYLEFLIKLVETGNATPHLWNKKVGESVKLRGPSGAFNLKETNKGNLVFVGAGTGVAPLRSMIKSLIEANTKKSLTLIFGTREETTISFKDEFLELEKKNKNFKFIPTISRPSPAWKGKTGHVQDNFESLPNLKDSVFYLCGLPAMILEAKQKLLDLGVKEEDIVLEKY